jgi:hypothetical protein
MRTLTLCALLLAIGTTAEGKTYVAERYHSNVEVLRGGTLRVTETVTLRFEEGTFTQFFRRVPTRSTEGIEVVSASMDGQIFTAGAGPGHVEIEPGSSRLRVTWRFPAVANASRTFALTYLVHGTVRQEEHADAVGWTLLPTEHDYRIETVAAEIVLPIAPSAQPTLETRRVGESSVAVDGSRVRVDGRNIGKNGWIEAWVRAPRGSIVDAPPAWQQREEHARQLSGAWVLAASVIFVAGVALLLGIRQGYDPPPEDLSPVTAWSAPPDPLPPPLAGVLLTNGTANLEHAMAAVISLADRGDIRIEATSRSLGQRAFSITRTSTGRAFTPVEERTLEIIFSGRHGAETTVTLAKARSRLTQHLRRFREVVNPEMKAAGLLDEDRQAVRRRFLRAGLTALVAAAVMAMAMAVAQLPHQYGGWPLLLPLALGAVAIVACIAHAAHTPLSNEGVRRSNRWRGFQRYLREVARDREAAPGDAAVGQLLPFAVALGVASGWSAYLKRHRSAAPPWFRAASLDGANPGVAFAAFVSSGGSGAGGHGHGGGGGAAGGGASGAR